MCCCVTRQHVVAPVVHVAVCQASPSELHSVLNSVPSVTVHLGLSAGAWALPSEDQSAS